MFIHSLSFNYLLVEQVYDSLLLFSKRCCLQLLSSNLCNSNFLISHLLTASFFYLLFFYPTSFLPIHHAAIHHAITHDPSIYVYGTILCSVFFYLLEPYSEFLRLSSYPPNLFSPSFFRSTFQKLPVYFYLSALMSMAAAYSATLQTRRFFGSKFNLSVNSLSCPSISCFPMLFHSPCGR